MVVIAFHFDILPKLFPHEQRPLPKAQILKDFSEWNKLNFYIISDVAPPSQLFVSFLSFAPGYLVFQWLWTEDCIEHFSLEAIRESHEQNSFFHDARVVTNLPVSCTDFMVKLKTKGSVRWSRSHIHGLFLSSVWLSSHQVLSSCCPAVCYSTHCCQATAFGSRVMSLC